MRFFLVSVFLLIQSSGAIASENIKEPDVYIQHSVSSCASAKSVILRKIPFYEKKYDLIGTWQKLHLFSFRGSNYRGFYVCNTQNKRVEIGITLLGIASWFESSVREKVIELGADLPILGSKKIRP